MNRSIGRTIMNVLSMFITLTVLALVAGALAAPDYNLFTVLSSALWTTFAPHLVLLAVVFLLFNTVAYCRNRSTVAAISLTLCAAAFAGAAFISYAIVSAAGAAGGSVSLLRGLALQSMNGNGPDQTVSYRQFADKTLNMAVYQPPNVSADTPVMLYVHGGGFKVGSNVETDADLRWFANQGWLVFSPQYRLWTEQTPTWDLAPEDIACAAIWLEANKARFGLQLNRFAILGDSAGGNLALSYAYAVAAGQLQSDCEGVAPAATAVVVQYPAVDPLAVYQHGFAVPGFEPKMLLTGYLGGEPFNLPHRVAAVSSYSYLSAGAPATLIIAPEKDALVPPWSVYRFADYARLAGVDVELVRIPFASHVYNQIAFQSIGNQARRTITARYLAEKVLTTEGLKH